MTKRILILSILLSVCSTSQAQVVETNDTRAVDSTSNATGGKPDRHSRKTSYGPLGRFNYLYLRVATFFPANGFSNPLATGFPGSENFTVTNDAPHSYRLGYESGKVRHIMKLNLGTPMLKLAINSGIALQAFGQGKQETASSSISTDGFYLMRLGLGPQLTFKPIKEVRIGAYYRPGIAGYYTNYRNEQTTLLGQNRVRVDKVDARFLNYAYNGDLGLDFSYNALSFGLCYSMLKAKTPAGDVANSANDNGFNVYSSYTERNGQLEGSETFSPISPEANLNRFSVSIGFMF